MTALDSALAKLEGSEPYPEAPRFFRRLMGDPGSVLALYSGGLVIYGFSCRSRFREDRPVEDRAWQTRRAFPSECFSEACPDGEWGMTPRGAVVEISEAEFRAAAEKGWET